MAKVLQIQSMFEPHNVKMFSFQCSGPQMVVHTALISDVGLVYSPLLQTAKFFKTNQKR